MKHFEQANKKKIFNKLSLIENNKNWVMNPYSKLFLLDLCTAYLLVDPEISRGRQLVKLLLCSVDFRG